LETARFRRAAKKFSPAQRDRVRCRSNPFSMFRSSACLNENAQKDYHHSAETPSASILHDDESIIAEGKQDDETPEIPWRTSSRNRIFLAPSGRVT
jgi:hypothetical protein